MIRSFACKHTEKLYRGDRVPRFQACAQQAEKRLQILESATCIEDLMNLPSNRFEARGGDRKGQQSIRINQQYQYLGDTLPVLRRKGQQSIRINQQWRICFEWREDGAYNVEIVDYH